MIFQFSNSTSVLKFKIFILSKKVNLGLDLQGGMHVILEADVPNLVKKLASNKSLELLNAIKKGTIINRPLYF